MKNKFITKKRKRKIRHIFIMLMFLTGIILSYKILEFSSIKISNKEFVNYIKNNAFNLKKESFVGALVNKTIDMNNPVKIMTREYKSTLVNTFNETETIDSTEPIIYLYNTHQGEEYASSNFLEFSLNPTVMMNNYILEDIFNRNNYKTIVEERSIKEVLNSNKWNYNYSYRASRYFLEDILKTYPSLKYFVDIHRDSVSKDKTTVMIKDKSYASLLFIVGLENHNYQENLEFTEKIHNKINELYPGLSKGIYKKGGEGVNGVYNQDFSNTTILIEVGGYQNNTYEVLNSCIAFSKAFMEVINE